MRPRNAHIYRVGWRGSVVVPASMCSRCGITRGSFVVIEEAEDGIIVYPAVPEARPTRPKGTAGFIIPGATDQLRVSWARASRRKRSLQDSEET